MRFKVFLNRWGKMLATFGVLVGVLFVNAALPGPALADPPDTTDVFFFDGSGQVDGASSTLHRHNNEVTMNIHTSELEAGAAYTVWWVVFNDPSNCAGACDGPDIDACAGAGNCDALGISVLWATGHVIGHNGVGEFAGHLKEGQAPGEVLLGSGLTDAQNAEIHLVVRSHGPPIPGLVEEQIHTFGGGCGVNTCEDVQFAVHLP